MKYYNIDKVKLPMLTTMKTTLTLIIVNILAVALATPIDADASLVVREGTAIEGRQTASGCTYL